VPSFYEPRVRNAARTLTMLGALLILLFLGVEALDVLYAAAPHPSGNPTVLSQIAEAVFTGDWRWLYFGVQFSTTLVLILAANTSFNGFPRLCGILARDDFLPHQFAQLGNRLVYSMAIVFLAVAATILMLAFSGNTDALINLFALGVFTAFSLAQTAMARQWWTRREPGWRRGLAINATGAVVSALVDVVIIVTKAPRGAWVVVVIVPVLVLAFMALNRYYRRVRAELARIPPGTDMPRLGAAIVPVWRWDEATGCAMAYAQELRGSAVALVAPGVGPPPYPPPGVELRDLPNRGLDALLREIDAIRRAPDAGVVTVVLPDEPLPLAAQVVLRPSLVRLKLALLWRRNLVAASSPRFGASPVERPHSVFVPISGINAVTVAALGYARALSPDVVAVHVVADVEHVAHAELDEVPGQFREWVARLDGRAPRLVIIESPYRAVVPPIISYVLHRRARHPDHVYTVVIPELVDRRLWTLGLHNHRAFWLKNALLRQPDIGVADVTFHLRGMH
jgi:hypothetical protein